MAAAFLLLFFLDAPSVCVCVWLCARVLLCVAATVNNRAVVVVVGGGGGEEMADAFARCTA